jgi:hypothetical protein
MAARKMIPCKVDNAAVTLIVVRTDNNFSENGREQDKA